MAIICDESLEVLSDDTYTGFAWSDVRAIDQAIATGIRVVHINNRDIEFQSVSQMLKAKSHMISSIQSKESMDSCYRRGRAVIARYR